MRKFQKIALWLIAVMIVAIAGCSSNTPPKKALLDALGNHAAADSYRIHMGMNFDDLEWTPSASTQPNTLIAAALIGMLKDANITVDGVYRKDPMQMDMDMEIVFPGDMEMKLSVPMIMTKEALYVKLPQIPMLQLPEGIAGKYMKLDLTQSASSDPENRNETEMDIEAQEKLSKEAANVLLESFEEKAYFSEPKAAEAGLPKDMKADRIVRFEINAGNYEQTVETFVNQTLPKLLDVLLANEAALPVLQLEKVDVEKMKTDMDTTKAKALDTLKNDVNLELFQVTGAIKDDYLAFTAMDATFKVSDKEEGKKLNLGMHINTSYSEINQSPELKYEIPTETITLEQLVQLFKSPNSM
ncbi:hypothetical protein [Paenibacillus harenae]|uniref:Uncharacterized protein n=1 Tax=Paenibacillus harenae TaxID=306543 RepID=A0ABT9UBC3_PAEHA|nr:hypothetical protein [Paenibacillus harenae]MDQ0116306.1 hypothetical protein [Paenibacillus harenae]